MNIGDLLSADSIHADFKASSKKQALQSLARRMAIKTGLDEREIFAKLAQGLAKVLPFLMPALQD